MDSLPNELLTELWTNLPNEGIKTMIETLPEVRTAFSDWNLWHQNIEKRFGISVNTIDAGLMITSMLENSIMIHSNVSLISDETVKVMGKIFLTPVTTIKDLAKEIYSRFGIMGNIDYRLVTDDDKLNYHTRYEPVEVDGAVQFLYHGYGGDNSVNASVKLFSVDIDMFTLNELDHWVKLKLKNIVPIIFPRNFEIIILPQEPTDRALAIIHQLLK